MKRTLMNVGMFFVMVVAIVAAGSNASAQEMNRGNRQRDETSHQRDGRSDNDRGDRHSRRRHKKNAHGYRNYGQYRRTQVGNRRSHRVNRYYTVNGVRRTRRVTINY